MITPDSQVQRVFVRQKALTIPNWPQTEIDAFNRFSVDDLIRLVQENLSPSLDAARAVEACYAIYRLREAQDQGSQKLLLEILERSDSWTLTCYAMDSLSYRVSHDSEGKFSISKLVNLSFGSTEKLVEQYCLRNLQHENPLVRCIAARSLKRIHNDRLMDFMLDRLVNESCPMVRAYIADALITTGTERQWNRKPLIQFDKALDQEDDFLAHVVLVEVCRAHGGRETTPVLVKIAQDGPRREQAVRNLGQWGVGREAEKVLVECLADDDSGIRGWAQESLAYFIAQKPIWLIKLEMGFLLFQLCRKLRSHQDAEKSESAKETISIGRQVCGLLFALGRSRNLMYFDWFSREGIYMFRKVYSAYLESLEQIEYPRDFYYAVLISNLIAIERFDILTERDKVAEDQRARVISVLVTMMEESGLSRIEGLDISRLKSEDKELAWQAAQEFFGLVFLGSLVACLETSNKSMTAYALYALGEWGNKETLSAIEKFTDDNEQVLWYDQGPWGGPEIQDIVVDGIPIAHMGPWHYSYPNGVHSPARQSISDLVKQAIAKIEARSNLESDNLSAYAKPQDIDVPGARPPYSSKGAMVQFEWGKMRGLRGGFYNDTTEGIEALFFDAVREDRNTNHPYPAAIQQLLADYLTFLSSEG